MSALLDPCICTACIMEGMLARDVFPTQQILALMKEFKMQMIPLLYCRQGHTSSGGQYTFVGDLLFVCVFVGKGCQGEGEQLGGRKQLLSSKYIV